MSDAGSSSKFPLFWTIPPAQSSSKFCWYAAARSADGMTMSAFSCRLHASSVQLVEPVQTDSRSRITYLWCMRSGMPLMDLNGTL